MAWYDYAVTQEHQGAWPGVETGIDLGVPYHTPVTALFGGEVTSVRTGPFGLLVDILANVPGFGPQKVTTNYTHLDTSAVHVGQQVPAGAFLGLSGGQLSGGSNPARPPYSTGPHLEFGIYRGGSFTSQAYDPTSIINAAKRGVLGGLVGSGATGGSGGDSGTPSPVQQGELGGGEAKKGEQAGAAAGDWLNRLLGALPGIGERTGFFVLALVILVFGGVILFGPQLANAGEKAAGTVAGAAAKA